MAIEKRMMVRRIQSIYSLAFVLAIVCGIAAVALGSKKEEKPAKVRIHYSANIAGEIEPCG